MIKTRAILLAALLAFAPLATQAQAPSQPIDRIAAVVNEEVILQSELDRAIANITAQYANNPGQLPPPGVLAKQVLERLILARLQVARAQESGIRVNDQEIDQAVGSIAQQNGMTAEQLQAQVARDGVSQAEFRNTLRDEITIQRMKQSFAQSRISVSESEVTNALAQQAGAGGGLQYRLAHILVALPEGATAEQIATGQSKIDGIKQIIDRGEMDFAAAAVRYSDSPNALEGGDLGWRPESEIPPTFAQTVRTMQPGQVFGPVRGSSGFQLIRLVETRAAPSASMVTQYRIRHIVAKGDDATAEAKLNTVRARVAGGAEFAALAKAESEDPESAAKGGDLGWMTIDTFGPDLGPRVAALKDGELSPPIKTPSGWHVIQVIERRQNAAGDDQQRAAMRETIGRRKLEDEYTRFLQEMRGDAFVEVRSQSVVGVAPAATNNGG